ncbi:hypothetical protein E4631_24850 [Hymenobacter sp. UV11]|uniref:hypothetical protein n=2 Tax=Hymenobacter sp. UV11 TaxID=1849735 RepID=UPI001060E5D1|nr:hypothetical protein [Hymenobacter sp. UV11]TFZ62607.1 hypothetical protein E4631_24850 [Hymenobacter sp. UV11]
MASNARRRTAMGEPTSLAAPVVAAGPTPSLPFDLQTVGVVAVGSALGTLGLRAVDKVFSTPSPPPSAPALPLLTVSVAPGPEDPANWLPAGLLTAAAPRVRLEGMNGEPAAVFVQLHYLGHTLYYQPSQRVLLWRAAPGQLQALYSAADVAFAAEQIPCDDAGTGPPPWLSASGGLKTIG